jgi:hypothetical protein
VHRQICQFHRVLDDREYLRLRDETERQLTLLPDHEKLVLFDRHRGTLVSMAENLARATPAQQAELVALLAEPVMVTATERAGPPPARARRGDGVGGKSSARTTSRGSAPSGRTLIRRDQ